MISFIKMHGLLNDFIIFDMRAETTTISAEILKHIGHRRKGVGCDQFIALHKPQNNENDVSVHIFNQDGSPAEMCGNAMRCVVKLLKEETPNQENFLIETKTRILECQAENDLYTVNMGGFSFDGKKIGLSENLNAQNIEKLRHQDLGAPCAISVGNPHLIFWAHHDKMPIFEATAPLLEKDSLFLNKINVSICEIVNEDEVKLRTFERGVGFTPACGSAACAAIAAGHTLQKLKPHVKVQMMGGDLHIRLQENTIFMTGPASKAFTGKIDLKDYI